jgi:predicted TIM-barrel fold metal-dependent hydrolase
VIVDSHTHVMSADTERYPTRTDLGHWFHGAGDVASLLAGMDAAGVDEAVLVQFVGGYGYDNRYVLDAQREAPDRLRICGAVDMFGSDPGGELRAIGDRVQAVRAFGVGSEEAVWLTDGRGDALWQACEETTTTVVATVWDRDLHHLRPLIEAHPGVPVAIDHCGFVDFGGDVSALLDLADLSAVHVKVSSHVLLPLPDPAATVSLLAGAFGADRLVWGSDHPQTEGSYASLVELARTAAAHLDEPGRADFLGGTARRLWFG